MSESSSSTSERAGTTGGLSGASLGSLPEVARPAVALPKGGGAIRGIDEKFTVNAVNGTGALSLAIPVTPGRSGFSPSLTLGYDSGSGNGVFGFGWSLGLPAISRKTDKGVPRYDDAGESDVFLLSGAEDLVPVLATGPDGSLLLQDGRPQVLDEPRVIASVAGPVRYSVRRYRPRIESAFARIERWTRADGDVHWRSYSADNLMSLYGVDTGSRIADPADEARVFRWLLCETRDDRGNAILYGYRPEDATGLDLAAPPEANRGAADDPRRRVNRHLKRIRYGNRRPLLVADGTRPAFLDPASVAVAEWLFEVVFDYGDHAADDPAPDDDSARGPDGALLHPWPARDDAFATCRPGFELRTLRLCRRVLMFHHMPGDAEMGRPTLVRAMTLSHTAATDAGPGYAFLSSAMLTGYRQAAGGRVARSLPPVSFTYSRITPASRVEALPADALETLPAGIPGLLPEAPGAWVDLYGEGLAGLLTEEGGGWFYRRNLGPLRVEGSGTDPPPACFAPAVAVARMPRASLTAGAMFLDLAGDGRPDLAVLSPPVPGFWEQDGHEGWEPFRPFAQPLRHDLADPGLRLVDLTGDGLADVLLAAEDGFIWHPSLGEAGFGPAHRVALAPDDEAAPRRLASSASESLHLADMSGDGLSDIVRIRNAEVSYWPNLGHGRFGPRIAMRDAPQLDDPDQFEPDRVLLADIDGSGTTDLVYLHRQGVRLVFNRSGDGWGAPVTLGLLPPVAEPARVAVLDLLGNGTASLVWSSPLPGDRGRQIRHASLMAGGKPHLLVALDNGMGAETRISYAPSTRFYLQDRREGHPWRHRLPFPVHVVERVEQIDHAARTRLVSRYAYHDGYFDGEEREFRGFGVVDQRDTETLAALGDGAPLAGNLDPAAHLPPVLTRTWFHTGGAGPADFAGGPLPRAFREPGATPAELAAMALAPQPLPPGLTPDELREAMRALKGAMLRQEVYAEDAGPEAPPEARARAAIPYRVSEQRAALRLLQPRGGNRHAAFVTHLAESIDWIYERNAADPRCTHRLVLEADDHGNLLKEARAGYPRRTLIRVFRDGQWQQVPNPALAALDPADRARQTTPLVTCVELQATQQVSLQQTWLAPRPCESVSYELANYPATGPGGRYLSGDLVQPDPARPGRLRLRPGADLPYEAAPVATPCRRVFDVQRLLYRRDDLSGLLPLGQTGMRALPGQRLRLAFTPGLLATVFRRPTPGGGDEALLADPGAVLTGQGGDQGGYVAGDALAAAGLLPAAEPPGRWWLPMARSFLAADPAAPPAAELAEGLAHFFLPRRFADPFGQVQIVTYDAHDLLPVETMDAVGNRIRAEVNDYRVLAPRRVRDANDNASAAAFDALGRVAGTALMGKADPANPEGDTLAGFDPDPAPADLLALLDGDALSVAAGLVAGASSRFVYDPDRFARSRAAAPGDPAAWQPVAVAFLEREDHLAQAPGPARIRIAITHADGQGRDIQAKTRAAPGPLVQGGSEVARWLTSGWVVLDNKGNPVRRYEPFFSATQAFEFGLRRGVSPVLFRDPPGRVVATLYPDGTYDKAVFDAWSETRFDVNDTAAARGAETGTPLGDRHIGGHVAAYLAALAAAGTPWQPWAAARAGGALGMDEANAATRAAAHADTPVTDHLDVLGRTFLTVTRNRTICPGHPRDGTEETLLSRSRLDIEGNAVEIRDPVATPATPMGRLVLRTSFDLLGRKLRSESLDAGTAWQLPDALGLPIRMWDARGHAFLMRHDALRRPLAQEVRGSGPEADPRTLGRVLVLERSEYGETVPQAAALNLRGRLWRRFDGAGVETTARLDAQDQPVEAYDFKGNALASTRRIAADYTALPDWSGPVTLLPERYESRSRFDALNRPVLSVPARPMRPGAPFQLIQPEYDEAGQVRRLDVWLDRPAMPAGRIDPAADPPSGAGIAQLRHDAHGRRERMVLANGAVTEYAYDPLTFRLVGLMTRRPAADFPADDPAPPDPAWPGRLVQNLAFTHDPAGNVTHMRDSAQQAIFFRNRRVEPDGDFTYDALYRLVEARGREHLGQSGAALPHSPQDSQRLRLPQPGDGTALSPYVERYLLDAVNGLAEMRHRSLGVAPVGWTRRFAADAPGRIEGAGAQPGNALTRTSLETGAAPPLVETLLHDPMGQVIRLPHLGGAPGAANLSWTPGRRLAGADLGGGGRVFLTHDAEGGRIRKVWEKSPGLVEERLYLGQTEIFRRHSGPIGAAAPVLERETLHVMDDRRRVALVETRRRDTAGTDPAPAQLVRHQIAGRLANVALELDDAGRLLSHEEYSPYGSTTYQAVRSQTDLPRRYRYAGKERDEETGLCDYGARLYAPWLGRWISPDPSGLADGPDPYVYARANPVTLTDPDGALAGAGDADPNSVLAAALALQQAARIISGTATAASATAASTGAVVAADVAATTVAAETMGVTAPAAGATAASLEIAAAGALLAAQVLAATAMALAVNLHMKRSANIVMYGNPWGLPKTDTAFPVLRVAREMRQTAPFPVPEPLPAPKPAPRGKPDEKTKEERPKPRPGRVYVTYTKYNKRTGLTYSGRTSAVIDLNKPWEPQARAAVALRDSNHHIDEDDEPDDPDFGPAIIDKFAVGYAVDYTQRYRDVGYLAIRGREQQMIDYHGKKESDRLGQKTFSGGAKSDSGKPYLTENNVRGVAKDNLSRKIFHNAADLAFGNKAAFTGNP